MSGHALTRRSFLVGSAGVAAVAAGAGLVSLSVRGEADADAETDKRTEVVHSLCNSCSSKCGYYAYVVDGELTKLIGDEAHPNAQGKLCARGYGYSDCEKVIGNFIIDILPQTDFVFDIQISEKDLLELLPQKVYNTVG